MSGKETKTPTEIGDEDLEGVEGGGTFDLGLTGTDSKVDGQRIGLRRREGRVGKRIRSIRIKKPNSLRS